MGKNKILWVAILCLALIGQIASADNHKFGEGFERHPKNKFGLQMAESKHDKNCECQKRGGVCKCGESCQKGSCFAERLNLTGEQREKLKALRNDQDRIAISKQREALRTKRAEFAKLLTDKNQTPDNIRSKLEELINLQADLKRAHFEKLIKIREILTAEQVQHLLELKDQKMAKRTEGRFEKKGNR
ncbi:MAG TPA: Spy/CpxP family protein refolding chaperone [Oligoflexia bacterium]|nr:Spy/CpxP family protein refolding chaperone [Oligoflexia bacterium]HMP27948.1 Spy/CpxP family protein refolding chaperone [Oligoflexia bacterium]